MYNKVYDQIESFNFKTLGSNKGYKTKINSLKKLGIYTLKDLIYFFPRAYENTAKLKKISELKDGENAIVRGIVVDLKVNIFNARKMIKALIKDENNAFLEVVWFNAPYISKTIFLNDNIQVTSKVRKKRALQMVNPSYIKLNSRSVKVNEVDKKEPIYPLTSGITQKFLIGIIEECINKYLFLFEENLPKSFILDNKLMDRKQAIINMHKPKYDKEYLEAKKRFIFEEALILETKILKNRYSENMKNSNMYFLNDNKKYVKEYVKNLPFELTKDQKKVISDIHKELNEGKIINRLLQGDVGSGKTIVALVMLLYMAENSYQGVIMAPTEILARQHYLEVCEEFSKYGIKVELLTGSVKGKYKDKIYSELKNGDIDILIGTHSLIEDNLEFKKLGLIVIDEQHKFGVEQRNKIRDKGIYANLIVMSATPIPRSLALTIYGDLDVSVIKTKPMGRKSIKTKWIKNKNEEKKMYEFIDDKIKEGRQIYVVSPLISDSDKLNLSSAEATFEEYKEKFPQYTIGLLHGKLNSKDKDKVMEEFKSNQIDILISTTVVEVGVNVPNSTIIIILSAERFGLSSLHQLRGRVGRSSMQAYCFLVSNTKNEISQKRLQIMEKTDDGFEIAEEDLKIRDTGEIFGIKQSGLSELKLVDIVENMTEILISKNFSQDYLKKNKGNIVDENLKIDIKNIKD